MFRRYAVFVSTFATFHAKDSVNYLGEQYIDRLAVTMGRVLGYIRVVCCCETLLELFNVFFVVRGAVATKTILKTEYIWNKAMKGILSRQ